MNANDLLIVGPPWIRMADVESEQFVSKVGELRASGGQVIMVDGASATTSAALFEEFARAAKLPQYFGRNWAALDECLADFEWLPGTSYVVILKNPGKLLELEPSERSVFVKIILKVAEEWADPVCDGEYWDRPSVPFHLVADYMEDDRARGGSVESGQAEGLEGLDVTFQELTDRRL